MENIPDTLVFNIVERDYQTNKIDTSLFILYDAKKQTFIIRGKRGETKNIKSKPYSFECDYSGNVCDFIQSTIDRKNKVSYVMYNNNSLPNYSNNITYDTLFFSGIDPEYEIFAYDNVKIIKEDLFKYLDMIRFIGNEY